jgi:hypothetical protein
MAVSRSQLFPKAPNHISLARDRQQGDPPRSPKGLHIAICPRALTAVLVSSAAGQPASPFLAAALLGPGYLLFTSLLFSHTQEGELENSNDIRAGKSSCHFRELAMMGRHRQNMKRVVVPR